MFFNTLSWKRKGLVKVSKSDLSSANLPTQSLDSDTCLLMVDVPSMGYKMFTQNVNMNSSASATYVSAHSFCSALFWNFWISV